MPGATADGWKKKILHQNFIEGTSLHGAKKPVKGPPKRLNSATYGINILAKNDA